MALASLIIVCAVVIAAGCAALALGWLGLRGTLPRNRYVGVRTPAALRDDETFRLANRVAAPPILASGAIAVVVGGCLAVLGGTGTGWLITGIGVFGALVLLVAGGVLGGRAAAAAPEPSGCAVCSTASGKDVPPASGGGGCAAAGLCSAAGGCFAATATAPPGGPGGNGSPAASGGA
ncbi:SdpI/YhfL protein family protein [Actinopolyspora xinjiangensis]|uniref:SdpI/YhfL protein family protein n=1 Tax=Actinopolyspora xinjiangensis TaxID=405564 RepID=A0A1H0VB18_9ACTN|nr:SdpI family protein [Actinopolyspora xinjiangensis]SDP75627.1 SdpI/YhfL protein family protein [Actinopolyspora xinjiangensis]